MSDQLSNRGASVLRPVAIALISVAILAAGGFCGVYFIKTKPVAQKRQSPSLMPVVEVQELVRSDQQITIEAMGTVQPAKEMTLKSQVSGMIVKLHESFAKGGRVIAGELLVQVDPADYELAVQRAEAALETARTQLRIEQGMQEIAKHEWETLGASDDANDLERELSLREPQLKASQAAVASAQAELDQARLDLARTDIRAPFDAVLRETYVELGDLASTQNALADLVGTDEYWIETSVPLDKLKWLKVPGAGSETGSAAEVFSATNGAREGKVVRLLSEVETEGRMGRVLVSVQDPLRVADGNPATPMLLGEYVRVQIEGQKLQNVVSMPRDALRDGSSLWLLTSDRKLTIRKVAPIWSDLQHVILDDEFDSGMRLIVSNLGFPVAGMSLRVAGEPEPVAAAGDGEGLAQGGEDD